MLKPLIGLLLLALMIWDPTRATADSRPNMIFFIADDISQEDFACYGHPTIKTPNIDSLAAAGMRFDNAYLTTSSCSPSRCSIITGRYPHNTGAPELHTRLPASQIRFTALLKDAGYYTALSGKNHMFGSKDPAFEHISTSNDPSRSGKWVDIVRDRPKDKPFFFWFASSDAHRAWQITKDIAPVYKPEDAIIPPYMIDGPGTRKDLANYYHEVSRFDHYIGLVIEELKKQNALDKTMIVVAADNGRPFPRAKSRLYDSGIKTPWIVHYPNLIKKEATSQSLISSIDLSATCLELAGLKQPAAIQGISFLPILKNPGAITRELIFAEQNWHVYQSHERMVRFGDFVYIKNNYRDQRNLVYEAHQDPAGEELWQAHAAGLTTPAQQQIFANPCPEEELFRLGKDGHQLVNLADNPEYADTLKQARKLLADWTSQTGDSIPADPTPNRHAPPRIENGQIIPAAKPNGPKNPHREMPGASNNATSINHPGPTRL